MYDLLIKGGRVIDGADGPSWTGDVAIKAGRIVAMGALDGQASQVIEAGGLAVAPGFIDLHTHSDLSFLVDPTAQSKVRQGVTLEVTGNCGTSTCAPLIGKEARENLRSRLAEFGARLEIDWTTFGEWMDRLEKAGSTVNLATLVGHGTVRAAVLGYADRGPTEEELEVMKRLVAESLDAGAMGLSTGLYFAPGSYARTEEVMEVAREAVRRGKMYASHIRDEFDYSVGLFCALQEAIEIGRQSGVRVEVSHTKCAGPAVWGMAHQVLEMMERARKEGIDVAGDQYPYAASNTPLAATVFPRSDQAGGRAATLKLLEDPVQRRRIYEYVERTLPERGGEDGIFISSFPPDPKLEGKSMKEVAAALGVEVPQAVIRLYQQHDFMCIVNNMRQDDVDLIAGSPFISVGSDGSSLSTTGPLSRSKPHPRNFGTYPRYVALYVRERKAVSLEEAVRKMTSLPASRLGLMKRGRLAPGYWADVVVFDPGRVKDTATFQKPQAYPVGIPHVIVNGVAVITNGEFTGKTPGKVVRSFDG